jgi:hypothetical protein
MKNNCNYSGEYDVIYTREGTVYTCPFCFETFTAKP